MKNTLYLITYSSFGEITNSVLQHVSKLLYSPVTVIIFKTFILVAIRHGDKLKKNMIFIQKLLICQIFLPSYSSIVKIPSNMKGQICPSFYNFRPKTLLGGFWKLETSCQNNTR